MSAATSTMAIDATTSANSVHVMECWIYKGSRRDETYLYLAAAEDWSSVPEPLLAAMGPLQLVMNLKLTPERPLARANAHSVIAALEQQGYYLQLPPARMPGQGSVQ
jgi:uncharacterized protein YcgL (UPF0745 family)